MSKTSNRWHIRDVACCLIFLLKVVAMICIRIGTSFTSSFTCLILLSSVRMLGQAYMTPAKANVKCSANRWDIRYKSLSVKEYINIIKQHYQSGRQLRVSPRISWTAVQLPYVSYRFRLWCLVTTFLSYFQIIVLYIDNITCRLIENLLQLWRITPQSDEL